MRKKLKILAVLVAMNFLFEIFYPTISYALGGGPSQPEVESFEPSGTTNMVDLFTGDFNYNIPLFDVEGYPVNIAYHSGITMDQEASWVGLGWNINPGAITRSVRGLPDDFKGDSITKEFNIKDNVSYGFNLNKGLEIAGLKAINNKFSLSAGLGIVYNNYKGLGYEFSVSSGISGGSKNKRLNMNMGLDLSVGSQTGASFNRTIAASWTGQLGESVNTFGLSLSSHFNTRSGLKTLSISSSYIISQERSLSDKYSPGQLQAMKDGKITANDYSAEIGEFGSGSRLSFAYPTIYPGINMPMKNNIITLNGTLGTEDYTINPNMGSTGYKSTQKLRYNNLQVPAYGYMYEEYGRDGDDNLKDFNREKDVPFNEKVPYLPLSSLTYDIYNITGQGISGMFRPHRNDIGVVFDQRLSNTSTSEYFGLELGMGNVFRGGANLDFSYSYTQSGKWENNNNLAGYVHFWGTDDISNSEAMKPLYEPVYFKVAGEKQAIDEIFYDKMGGESPVRIAFDSNYNLPPESRIILDHKYQYKDRGQKTTINDDLYKLSREPRSQVISSLTFAELRNLGLNYYEIYDINHHDAYYGSTDNQPTYEHWNSIMNIGIKDTIRKGHHTGRITVLSPDGRRYVYGIAAYNVKQIEKTFNVGCNNNGSNNTGLVAYNESDKDNTTSNKKGINNYYNCIKTPPYAHSYLLTEILSNDYIDCDNDGKISSEDAGMAVKFNYSRLPYYYHWRVPYGHDKANFEEGFKTDQNDDKGSYIYGEKEIWYVHSIESRNYILEFYLSPREDAIGCQDENGAMDLNQKLYKIDSISLYPKQAAYFSKDKIPIKTVHFEYDYSLCQNLPNQSRTSGQTGKLTLRSLYFTYGKTNKSKINAYHFTYSSVNPDYSLKGYDRWGNYKPNNPDFPNFENPYVTQVKELAGEYSSAWSLTSVMLPSGGTINITYESDDYAYVQNRQAMMMDDVLGLSDTNIFSNKNNLFYHSKHDDKRYNYIFFRLPEPITTGSPVDRKKILQRDYIGNDSLLYFKFMVNLLNTGTATDFVPGYASIEDFGMAYNAGQLSDTIGYIKIREIKMYNRENEMANSIASAVWQFLKYNLSQKIFGDEIGQNKLKINSFSKYWNNVKVLFKGYDKFLENGNYGSSVVLNKSKIRLLCPTMVKYGGGCRVKEISISDNWTNMGQDRPQMTYGQKFEYTKEITLPGGIKKIISSGVASYEPIIGNEENPFRRPLGFDKETLLIPDTDILLEEPLGESFFPAPVVGYSSVKVTNLKPTTVHKHATGYTITEFYTAQDFPTRIYQPVSYDIRRIQPGKTSFLKLFNLSYYDYTYASQGYAIELNDMHGKLKSEKVYQEPSDPTQDAKPISSVSYEYFVDKNDTTVLGNNVTVIDNNNNVSEKYMGKEKDVLVDIRDNSTNTYDPSLGLNLDVFTVLGIPIPVFTMWPTLKVENTSFKSVVVTKVIQKYGILKRTIATDLGSTVTTENVAFDSETGDVLLTKVNNEYNDTIYKFDYPAWWIYRGMGQACNNINGNFNNVTFVNGYISPGNYANFFTPGDEIMLSKNDNGTFYPQKIWTLENRKNRIVFIDEHGKPVNITMSGIIAKIIRSGERNILGAKAGTVATLAKPISGGSLNLSSNILNSNATVYSEQWQTYYHPPLKKCDSINIFACNFLKIINLLWGDSTQFTIRDIAKNSDSCLNYGGSGLHPAFDSMGGLTYRYGSVSNDSTTFNGQFGSPGGRNTKYNHEYYNFQLITMNGKAFNWWKKGVHFGNIRLMPDDSNRETYKFLLDAYVGNDTIEMMAYENFVPVNTCKCDIYAYLKAGDVANPYLLGVRGNWRTKRQYSYTATRHQTLDKAHNNGTDIRTDGTYDSYTPFWTYNPTATKWQENSNINGWIWSEENTLYDPHGTVLESRDPLNRYSSQILGYNYTKITGDAGNSKNNNLFYDGFESYDYYPGRTLCATTSLWSFDVNFLQHRTINQAHTGFLSLYFNSNSSDSVIKIIDDTTSFYIDTTIIPNNVYRLKPSDFIYGFMPDHQKYVISGWVCEPAITGNNYNSYISVIQKDGSGNILKSEKFYPSGNIIDYWQRIYGNFTFIFPATQLEIKLTAVDYTYFDDIRVHPFNSNMKSYVYDNSTLRLIAELDENNYATFYEYDEEGNLVRIKKETINGIVTIQESRKSLRK